MTSKLCWRLPILVIGIVLDHKFYANDLEKWRTLSDELALKQEMWLQCYLHMTYMYLMHNDDFPYCFSEEFSLAQEMWLHYYASLNNVYWYWLPLLSFGRILPNVVSVNRRVPSSCKNCYCHEYVENKAWGWTLCLHWDNGSGPGTRGNSHISNAEVWRTLQRNEPLKPPAAWLLHLCTARTKLRRCRWTRIWTIH